MSGGEQQMLAIARALMGRPGCCSSTSRRSAWPRWSPASCSSAWARSTASTGTTVLVVEQNANLALEIADRGYVLEAGTIVAAGSADELMRDESVRKAYLGF